MHYVEPGAIVSLNNELVAAQATALAAEEAVLASLTQLVADGMHEVQALLDGVAGLDAARARSRCAVTCMCHMHVLSHCAVYTVRTSRTTQT